MKRTLVLIAPIAIFVAIFSLSCDQLGLGASPTPSPASTPTPGLSWIEVGSAGAPAFENTWSNYGSGYQTCAYALDAQGQLHIVGFLQHAVTGPDGDTVFTLPAGYRPKSYQRFSIGMMGSSMQLPQSGVLTVLTNGQVIINPPDGNTDAYADLGQQIVKLQ